MGHKCTLKKERHQKPPGGLKDKYSIILKSGVIYRFMCDRMECDEEYIGESSRVFGERFKEHLKAPSPIYDNCNITGHTITVDNSV